MCYRNGFLKLIGGTLVAIVIIWCWALGTAFAAEKAATRWVFEKRIDKMTDATKCELRAPQAKHLSLSFHPDGAFLFALNGIAALSLDLGRGQLRIDGDPPMDIYVHKLGPLVGRFDRGDGLMDRLASGRTLLLRVGGTDEEIPLRTFAPAFAAYRKCIGA